MSHNVGTDQVRATRREMWRAWARALGREDPERSMMVPMMRDLMRRCRVFRVPGGFYTDANEIAMSARFANDAVEWMPKMTDTFILPFPVVALEGPHESVVWLVKMFESIEGGYVGSKSSPGLGGVWLSVAMRSMPRSELQPEIANASVLSSVVIASRVDFDLESDELLIGVNVTGAMALDTRGSIKMLYDKGELEPSLREVVIQSHGAYPGGKISRDAIEEELASISESLVHLASHFFVLVQIPRNFIVEIEADAKSPQKKKRTGKKAKRGTDIQSLSTKPIYISMAPKEIRKYVGAEEPEPGSSKMRAPHERRAHMRLLTSERFTWKRGEVVPVKATWVGPTRGITNEGREYRVRLDIASPHTEGGAE